MIFEFDRCVLDTAKQQLWRDDEEVRVEPQVLAVLEFLIARRERVVSKIELLDEVWGDRFVSESALTSRIKLARRACGDNGRDQRIVQTVHSRGFRFVADVAAHDPAANAARVEPALVASAPPRVDGSRPAVRASSTTLFGRDRELARLDAALARAAAGRPAAVFVRGGMGAGKSTLVAEFLEREDALDNWLVARGRCMQTRHEVEPYFCLFDALANLDRAAPAAVRAALDRLAPSWLAQMPALLDAASAERLERRLLGSTAPRMLREGAELFEALARDAPLLLLIEDLQWADDHSLDVVELLLQRREPVPLLVIATARAEHLRTNAVVARAATNGAEVIELAPLDRAAVARLVEDRLTGLRVPDELISIVHERSGGIPLFAEEIVAAWLRQGDIALTADTVELVGSPAALEATVPTTLPPLIERELSALDPTTQTVLDACAVVGEGFDAASVAVGLRQPVDETEAVLTAVAREGGLIGATGAAPWPDGTISASYRFTHGLYRQVVYERLSAGQRALLHHRIGLGLEAAWGARASELAVTLARHFVEAGDAHRAAVHLRRAGEQASARGVHQLAVTIFDEALGRLGAISPSAERDHLELELRASLGPALVATRGWFDESVAANYERALELCPDATSAEAAAARYGLATVSELRGQFARTEALLTPLFAGEREGYLAVEAHELVACSTFHQGAFDRSLRNARKVLDSWDDDTYSVLMARIAEHPASSCNSWSSLASFVLGDSDESLRAAERAVRLGEKNRYALSTAVQQRAMLHQIRNEPDECIRWSQRCRQVGEDQDFPMRVIQADIYKGWALAVSGSPDEGSALIADGLERFRAAGAMLNEPYYLGLYADARRHAGDPVHAEALLDEALTHMRAATRTYFFEAEIHRLRAACRLDRGGTDALADARAALREAVAVAEAQRAPAFALRALTDRLALEQAHGDPAPWRVEVLGLLSRYEGQAPTPDTARARALSAA